MATSNVLTVTPNPILVAFFTREDYRNKYALRQWRNFLSQWDNSICEATHAQRQQAYRMFTMLLGE